MSEYKLHLGNCLDHLEFMPDNSVDSIVTDPPYGLSFMGKKWDYDVPAVEIWAECLRVLKPGGHLLAFAGTRTQHRMAINIEDAGFEIRDMIAWVYGSGFPKSHNLKDDWEGWGTALKPALEPITVARKPFKGTIAANVQAHGTGGLNIDGCRVPFAGEQDEQESKQKNKHGDFGSGPMSNKVFGEYKKDRDNYDAPGRWPANLIHDGHDEVVALFPESSVTGKRSAKSQSAEVNGTNWLTGNHESTEYTDQGSAARFFKQVEVTDAEWLENLSPALIAGSTLSLSKLADAIAQSDAAISALPEGRQLNVLKAPSTSVTPSESKLIATSVITAIQSIASASLLAQQPERLSLSRSHVSVVAHQTPTGTMTITASLSSSAGCAESITFSITPKSLVAGEKGCEQSSARFMYCAKASKKDRGEGNNHPTVKPTELMAYLCRLVTPPGGVVLDPFMGSGSTGKAAMREGFHFMGIEMDPEYLAIAEARIKHEANKNTR